MNRQGYDHDPRLGAAGGWPPTELHPPGIELFEQGGQPIAVYRIDRGLVKLTRMEPDGQERIVGLRRPGSLLGSAEAVLDRPYAATAAVLTRCHLRGLPAADFRLLVTTDAATSWHLHQTQSGEVYDQMQLAGLACVPARLRLEHFLWELVAAPAPTPQPVRLQMPLKQWELALLIGVTREHLNRMLKQLEGDGVLHRHKGWLLIPDTGRLWHEA